MLTNNWHKTMMYWQVMLPRVKILLYEKNARPAA